MAKKKSTKIIAIEERCAAARYFAMSNTAIIETAISAVHRKPPYDIYYVYSIADNIMASETGESLNAEYKDWLNMVSEPNDYCFEEWEKKKVEYTW